MLSRVGMPIPIPIPAPTTPRILTITRGEKTSVFRGCPVGVHRTRGNTDENARSIPATPPRRPLTPGTHPGGVVGDPSPAAKPFLHREFSKRRPLATPPKSAIIKVAKPHQNFFNGKRERAMGKKMIECKTCGAEIAKSAKICPHCGAKNKAKTPKWLVALAIAIVVFRTIDLSTGSEPSGSKSTVDAAVSASVESEVIEYTAYKVDKLVDALESNALKAEKDYLDQYVELTGKLVNIDSDGDYISLAPVGNMYSFLRVQCFVTDPAQEDAILDLSIGNTVKVKGQVTHIGEVLGYQLDIDEIVK